MGPRARESGSRTTRSQNEASCIKHWQTSFRAASVPEQLGVETKTDTDTDADAANAHGRPQAPSEGAAAAEPGTRPPDADVGQSRRLQQIYRAGPKQITSSPSCRSTSGGWIQQVTDHTPAHTLACMHSRRNVNDVPHCQRPACSVWYDCTSARCCRSLAIGCCQYWRSTCGSQSPHSLTHEYGFGRGPTQRERVVTGDDKRWEPQQRESRGPVGCLSYFRL